MRKERKHFTPEEKVAILRRHLVDKVPVSELCEELGLPPTMFYRWQKELFENGAATFQSQERPHREVEEKQKRIEFLEKRCGPRTRSWLSVAAQPKQFCATSMPLALNAVVFVVVVAVFQMPLCIASAAGHGSYSQHIPTVALFEIRLQRSAPEKQRACRYTCCAPSGDRHHP
jgi:transposase